MKFNYKGRGFVIITLTAMLVVVGTVNYQLSKKSLLKHQKSLRHMKKHSCKKILMIVIVVRQRILVMWINKVVRKVLILI
ncbi:hypothetical protein [Clostridioides difficile]|uniref:hypothetical protein n=1 Tax=Clostridioides difficile TaxID=1496 RepID=UPI001F251819|nr:hypothetical protein [Clostridioides difficile]